MQTQGHSRHVTTVFTSIHATGAKQVSGAAAKIIRRIEMLEKILEGIERLHIRILKDKFAEKVTEQEIEALVAAKEIIKQHMNDGWIPCAERMPGKDDSVLMCDAAGCREVGWWTGKRWVTGFSHADTEKDIVAWQPLPEPYHTEKGRE